MEQDGSGVTLSEGGHPRGGAARSAHHSDPTDGHRLTAPPKYPSAQIKTRIRGTSSKRRKDGGKGKREKGGKGKLGWLSLKREEVDWNGKFLKMEGSVGFRSRKLKDL